MHPLRILSTVVLVKAALMLLIIQFGGIDLGPDEAQYWTWSQQLDWGYYSKPPGIAWQIWLGTTAFGNTALGVRIGAVVISGLLAFAVYRVSRACGSSERTAMWAGIVMALTPVGLLGSLMTTTDGGLVLFWTLAIAEIARGIERHRPPNYLLFGLLVGLGALFKWPAYYLWAPAFIAAWRCPVLRSRQIIAGFLVSLLALLPSIYWNMSNEWATFRHVGSTIVTPSPTKANVGDFLLAQAGLIGPVVFGILLYSWTRLRTLRWSLWFIAITSLTFIAFNTGLSCFKKMQGNWCIYAYPMAIPVVVHVCTQIRPRLHQWLVGGVAVVAVVTTAIFIIPSLQPYTRLPYKANPFRHNVGWRALPAALARAGYDPDTTTLISDKYQTSSLVSFYNPDQARAYFLNIHGRRHNQFSYWPQLEPGADSLFVYTENVDRLDNGIAPQATYFLDKLSPFFADVALAESATLYSVGRKPAKIALIFRCQGYNGHEPSKSNLY